MSSVGANAMAAFTAPVSRGGGPMATSAPTARAGGLCSRRARARLLGRPGCGGYAGSTPRGAYSRKVARRVSVSVSAALDTEAPSAPPPVPANLPHGVGEKTLTKTIVRQGDSLVP